MIEENPFDAGDKCGGNFERFQCKVSRVRQPRCCEPARDCRPDAIVDAAKTAVNAGKMVEPGFFELPEGQKLAVGKARAAAACDLKQWPDHPAMPARRRSHDKT